MLRWSAEAEAILSRIGGFELRIGGDLPPLRFVNRVGEARKIIIGHPPIARVVFHPGITILYGPRGCGKSTLLRTLSWASRGASSVKLHVVSLREDWRAIEIESPDEGLVRGFASWLSRGGGLDVGVSVGLGLPGFLGAQLTVSRRLGEAISMAEGLALVGEFAGYVARSSGGGDRHVIVLDEFRAYTEVDYGALRSHVENLYNKLLFSIIPAMEAKHSEIAYAIATSDASVIKIWRTPSKETYALMWNLPMEAAEELSERLGLREDREVLWKLTGGNPRALIDVRRRGLQRWLSEEVLEKIIDVMGKIYRSAGERISKEEVLRGIGRAGAHPDEIFEETPAPRDVYEALVGENIVLRIVGEILSELPREPWIGRRYAYQLPAYMYALRAIARKRTSEIKLEDIVREMDSGYRYA